MTSFPGHFSLFALTSLEDVRRKEVDKRIAIQTSSERQLLCSFAAYVKPMEGGNGQGGRGGGTEEILLIEQIGRESMKYYIAGGKGQKQPPGPDRVGLTGTQGVEVIEGHAGQMTDRGTPGKATICLDGKYFDSARSHSGGQASSVLKRNQEVPLIKHPTQTHNDEAAREISSRMHTENSLLFLLLNSLISSSQRGEVALRKRIKFRSVLISRWRT